MRFTPGFLFDFLAAPIDSLVVVYEKTYKITHYVKRPTNTSPKYYPYASPGNIMNSESYKFEAKKLTSHSVELTPPLPVYRTGLLGC